MSRIKKKALETPLLGESLRKSSQIVHLRSDVQVMKHNIDSAQNKINHLESKISEVELIISEDQKSISESLKNLNENINELSKALNILSDRVDDAVNSIRPVMGNSKKVPEQSSQLFADNHSLDKFYVEFENKFRGSEELILDRLSVYKSYFRNKTSNFFTKAPALDLGCGRGEMLTFLKNNNINAIGVDLNEAMVKRAVEKGHKAVQANAIEYLQEQKTASIGAITGFHLIEHIPFELLIELFDQSRRVLKSDGFIIFETPNPENISVSSLQFHYDPSHLKPLPPELIKFVAETAGFKKVEILRLHPLESTEEQADKSEADKRLTTFQDYAVIGYK